MFIFVAKNVFIVEFYDPMNEGIGITNFYVILLLIRTDNVATLMNFNGLCTKIAGCVIAFHSDVFELDH